MSTSINNTIACNEPHANLDSYYGPYDSVNEALEALADVTIAGVTYHKRHVGLTIGIWNRAKTDITEYWFKGGIGDSNLTEKSSGGGGGGLPGNIKVVTFDKNGGSGAQNSILTDDDSKACLPQPTIAFSGRSFNSWKYGSTNYQPGDTITVGADTVVQAQWSGGTQTRQISWNNGTGINSITGFDVTANTSINSGSQVEVGHTVRLTATVESDYTFTNWTGTITSTDNPVEFSVGSSDISETANAAQISVLNYSKNDSIERVIAVYDDSGEQINTGDTVDVGVYVRLEAIPKDGNVFYEWTGLPSGTDPSRNPVVFKTVVGTMNIEACGKTETTTYTIKWVSTEEGIESVECINVNTGETINNGDEVVEGTVISLSANVMDGYVFNTWDGLPETVVDPTAETVEFALNENVTATPKATQIIKYRIKWVENENYEIEAHDGYGNEISNDSPVINGTNVTLEATVHNGYVFDSWSGLPSGARTDVNPTTFSLTEDVINIVANVNQPQPETYNLSIINDTGVDYSKITVNGVDEGIVTSFNVPNDSTVVISSTPEAEYAISGWEFTPKITPTSQTETTVTFEMNQNIKVTVKATQQVVNDFYYYGTNVNEENRAKGGSFETGEGGETSEVGNKWFEKISDLNYVKNSTTQLEGNTYNYIYVVTNSSKPPLCSYGGTNAEFVSLKDCSDSDVMNNFIGVGWYDNETNMTKGDLNDVGNYIYIIINNDMLEKDVTISLSNKEEK